MDKLEESDTKRRVSIKAGIFSSSVFVSFMLCLVIVICLFNG